jgi:diguanylate cyclase (GGDEF)-like protein
MTGRLNAFLIRRSRSELGGIAVGLLALVTVLDYVTGYEISFSVFYLLPVAVAAWYLGRGPGAIASGAAALAWFSVDLASAHPYSSRGIAVWNALVRLGFFFVTADLLARLHGALQHSADLAQRDGLTGAFNGRAFRERCEYAFQLAARHKHSVAIAYLDIDDFKEVNDRHGHAGGDQLLQRVVSTIAERARASDVVGRLGGDEFAILMPQTDLAGAGALMSDLRMRLKGMTDEAGMQVGFSIGVAAFDTPPASADDAIGVADSLMYEVKRRAKNDVLFREYGRPRRQLV